MDLNQIVDELYGLAPTEFTARRDHLSAQAKKAGDRDLAAAVKALRRPSAAAYAVNLMARTRGDRIDALIELGGQMKAAQDALSGEGLRALGRQRSQLIHAVTQEVRRVAHDAGHPVSEAAAREIESTLEAAFADSWAGQAVRQGRLVRALERAGLGPADLEGAVAGSLAPPSGPARSAKTKPTGGADAEAPRARAAAEAAEAADRADEQATETAEQLATAVADLEAAGARRAEAEAEARRLEEDLRAARATADQAADAESEARRVRRHAEQAHEDAVRAAERARAKADSMKA
jgi:hypothetical protein